jgi:hypothetical protein
MTDKIDDLRDRILGNRYYDQEADESFTVVGLSSHEGEPILAFFQYDDGVVWDELATPEMLSPEKAEHLRVEEGGIDSERYVPLGSGPTLGESDRLCPDGEHDWTPQPQEIWPDGVPDGIPDTLAPSDLYNRIARCKRCGLSGEVASQLKSHATPWFCARCGEVWGDLSYRVDGWEDTPVCPKCWDELPLFS